MEVTEGGEEDGGGGIAEGLNNLNIETAGQRRRQKKAWRPLLGRRHRIWRWRRTEGARERTGEGRLNGHWEPLNFSLRNQS